MPISAKALGVGASLEQIRQEFNNLQSDVNILQQSPTYGESLIFEGATSDAYETTLSVQDPTADRTVLLPNEDGTLLTSGATINATTSAITANNSTNETVYILFADGASGNQGLESDTSLTYNPSTNLLTTGNIVVGDAGNIGSASDTDAISISSGGAVQLTQTLTVAGTTTHTGTTTHNEDVTFTGAANNAVWDKSDNALEFADNAKAIFGTGGDFEIYHSTDNNTYLTETGSGNLHLRASNLYLDDHDGTQMLLATENGAVALYHNGSVKLATSAAGISVTGTATMSANVVIADAGNIGSASDTDAIAISSGGVVTFSQTPVFSLDVTIEDDLYLDSDSATIHFGEDGDVQLIHVADTGLRLPDGDALQFGTGADLAIHHDGSNSYISDSGTGGLIIQSSQLLVKNAAGNETMMAATEDSGAALYHNGVNKLGTTSNGVTITGTATVSGNLTVADGGTIGTPSDADAMTISAAGVVTFSQTPVLGSDLNLADDLFLDSDGSVIHFGDDGDVTLTHVADTGLRLEDSDKMLFGAGADLEIYHDGSNSYINDTGTGTLNIRSNTIYLKKYATSETMASFAADGAVTLYHDNTAKIATSAAGVTVSGSILIADGGNIGSASDADSLAIDASGNITASQNVTVTGNLTVNGTTTTVATSNTIIGDSLIELNNGAGSNSNDLGIVMERGSTGDNAIFLWDESGDHFSVGTTTATGASTGNLTYTLANFSASSIVGTLSTAAQTNITSLGTLTTLTVDNVIINGTDIGHTGDTDLLGLASGVLTVRGRTDVTGSIYLTGDEKDVRWYNGSNYVNVRANSNLSSNLTFTLPTADGSAGQALVTDASGNLSFAANNVGNATSFTTVANNSTDETAYIVFVDGATGEQGPETDTALTYNPSTGLLSTAAITLTGALTVGGTTTLNGNLVLGDAAADTLTVGATLQGASPLTFEGGTADGNETTFAITDPTADRTITFPDATGTVVLSGAVDLNFTGANYNALWDTSADAMHFNDNAKVRLGSGGDMDIYHNGTDNYIQSGTGDLILDVSGDIVLDADGADLHFKDGGTSIATFEKYDVGNGGLRIITHQSDADIVFRINDGGSAMDVMTIDSSDAGTLILQHDLNLDSDGAILYFGEDQDVSLTHVADNGLRMADSRAMYFGADTDLAIFHDGSNSYIQDQGTGSLIVKSNQFIVRNAAGSENMFDATQDGAVNLYYDNTAHLTTSSAGGTLTGTWNVTTAFNPDAADGATLGSASAEWSDLYLADSAVIYFGADQDVELHHIADTGLRLPDNDKFQLGADGDLSLFHDGSNSYIHDSGAGALYLATSLFHVTNNNATESIIYAAENGGVNLYFDNAKKLETLTGGVEVTGALTSNAADGGALGSAAKEWSDLYLADGATIQFGNDQDVVLTHVADSGIRLNDSDKMLFGAGSDLEIYHDGSNSIIADVGTGVLAIRGSVVHIQNAAGSENAIVATQDGAVQLFNDNSEKFTTTSTGISVTGGIVNSDNVHLRHDGVRLHFGVNDDVYLEHVHDVGLRMPDGDKLSFGTSDDLVIYHDGSNSALTHSGTGDFYVQSDQFYFRSASTSENMITGTVNGAVSLYYDNAVKLATVAGGVNVTGGMTITDNVHLDHDGVILHFGDDNDITLTHVHDTGLLLNSTKQLQFNDASQYICGASATQLDIRATDEIELTATTVDLNGNLDVSGTVTCASPGATLLVKNSSGTTLKTIKGMT